MKYALALLALLCGCAPGGGITPQTAADVAADAKLIIITADGIAQIACLAIKDPSDSARCSAIATETARILEANAATVERKALADAAAQKPMPAGGPDERKLPDP